MTSTKQFIWQALERSEERDLAGSQTKILLSSGQVNGVTKYFASFDHLDSIRELSNSSGVAESQYQFDPFGRKSTISETVASEFDFAGYYYHARTGLEITFARPYSTIWGRFICRDPLEEEGGRNLFTYVGNRPVLLSDPLGLFDVGTGIGLAGLGAGALGGAEGAAAGAGLIGLGPVGWSLIGTGIIVTIVIINAGGKKARA